MERYDYRQAVKDDIRQYIDDNADMIEGTLNDCSDFDEFEQMLNDILWLEDSVTGNASGSYTFSRWKAEENLCHNLDLLGEALSEFGSDPAKIMESPEACDVTIRCYLLSEMLGEVLDELEEDDEEDDDEDETSEEDETC